MHLSSPGIQSKTTTLALGLLLLTLWLLMHGYHGLTGDAQIYAFQALARIHPQLANDLYLQNTSQDHFTIFSPFYAWFIRLLGLENSARLLTMLSAAWLLTAAWSFACALTSRDAAWLAVAFLLIIGGDYGGAGVFHFSEDFLTARLPAQALVITAIACHFRGMKRLGLLLAVGALCVHPLMALPGLLLLICLLLPGRLSVIGTIAGLLTVLGIAVGAVFLPALSHALPVMDTAWLDVVRERSQFLFLQQWSLRDWEVNTQPFIYLGFTAIVIQDERIRRLCAAAALVGTAGLAVALIGSLLGPAILIQGQAWRWVWITAFVAALLLPATALQVWRDEKCGPLCVILLAAGWTLPAGQGMACVSLALVMWIARTYLDDRVVHLFRWAYAVVGVALIAWILIGCWEIVSPSTSAPHPEPSAAVQMRDIFGLKIPALLLGVPAWWWIRNPRNIWVPTFLAAMLAALSIFILPAAFKQNRTWASPTDINDFASWANAIPRDRSVLVAPAQDVGGFVWFTLQRPNYLSVDQSAGVVFSRTTALEVQRRSDVLLPLMDPNWKVQTSLRAAAAAKGKHKVGAVTRPLTAESLAQVCNDPQLGFVVSPENVGFNPLRHEHAGAWKDWNLYDCGKVRRHMQTK
jgi:hypothetical protein